MNTAVHGAWRRRAGRVSVVAVLLLVAAAPLSALAAPGDAKDPDPWKGLNRVIHGFNQFFDRYLLRPVAKTYDVVMPNPLQRGVSNAFDNIGTPWIAANQLMQGKPRYALSDLLRFSINSTLGVAGLFDVATHSGLGKHQEDFGQTLSVWGVARGPYFVVPLRGPSTVTDTVGMVVDSFANPIRYINHVRTRNTVIALYFIDARARLLEAETLITGDEYLFMRDAYLQRRDFLIKDGAIEEDPFLDDDFELDE